MARAAQARHPSHVGSSVLVRSLLQMIVHPAVLLDRHARVVAANPSAGLLLDLADEPDEPTDLRAAPQTFLAPPDVDRLVDAVERVERTGDGVGGYLDHWSRPERWQVAVERLAVDEGDSTVVLVVFARVEPEAAPEGEGPSRGAAPLGTSVTERELDVLRGLAAGYETQELADALGVSVETVRGYIKAVQQKLHAHSRLQVVVEGVRAGLVEIPTDTDDAKTAVG